MNENIETHTIIIKEWIEKTTETGAKEQFTITVNIMIQT